MAAHAGLFVPRDTAGNGTSALDGRLALGGLIGTVQRCISGGTITSSGSNMQFGVNQSVFALTDLDNAGAMMLTPFDATILPAIPAGPSSGSRIDSIIVRQQIVGNSLGDTATTGLMQTVQGTASTGTPSPPTIPVGWYEHARITVPTNASTASACTVQVIYPAVLAPLPITAPSFPQLQLMPGATTGQIAFVGTTEYRWTGTLWRPFSSDWANYTPSSNWGGTAPTLRWRWENGSLRVRGRATMTAGFAIPATGYFTFTLPSGSGFTPTGFVEGGSEICGTAMCNKNSGAAYPSVALASVNSANAIDVQAENASGTYVTTQGVTATVPLTWAVGDYFSVDALLTPTGTGL